MEGVNYTKTFAAAAKLPSVRCVLANAAELDWEIHQIDVKSPYLNAPLKETVYMKIPRGVARHGEEGKACRLLKGMYGLKQAGRGWHRELTRIFVEELKFTQSGIDHSVFYRKAWDEHTIIAVAMDDIIITSKQKADISKLKSEVRHFWEITDMGEISWYLGFKIRRNRSCQMVSINQ